MSSLLMHNMGNVKKILKNVLIKQFGSTIDCIIKSHNYVGMQSAESI